MCAVAAGFEFELNRKWILDEETGEPIGETNFIVPGDWLEDLFSEKFASSYSDFDTFLEEYEPETDGELIYQRALKDGVLVNDEYVSDTDTEDAE